MNQRKIILGLAAAVFLAAATFSWRAGQTHGSRSQTSNEIAFAATATKSAANRIARKVSVFARDHMAEVSTELDAPLMQLAQIMAGEDADERLAALEAWVEKIPATQVRPLLERLSASDQAGVVGQLLVRHLTGMDTRAAAEWVEKLTESEARRTLQAAVALAWSETDLPGALAWARALPGEDASEHVFTQLGYEVARESPVEALALAVNLPPTAEREALILHGLRQWAAADAEAARAWLLQWPENEMRHRALADFATVLADQDGDAGARFAVGYLAPGTDFERAIIGVVQRWAQRDLPATQAWIETFPATSLRDQAGQVAANIGSH